MPERRVVIVSNRVPPMPTAERPWPAGGLVSALMPPLLDHGGMWFGWSGEVGDPDRPPMREVTDSIDYVHIDLAAEDVEDYYEGFCNRTLWPRLHMLDDQAQSLPREFWTYREVNRHFAFALFPLLGANDIVWVHDFHLIPLGRELRRLGWRGPLAYFHHVPVPSEEHWTRIPHHDDLLDCLGHYEMIGVQTDRDAARLCALLPASQHELVAVHPVGIDPELFRSRAATSPDPLEREGDSREVLFGVDRLDYTKGIGQRLEAFERLLMRNPELLERVRFVQWAAPSRESVPEYQAEREAVETVAGRINQTFGAPEPVELSIEAHEPEEVAAALERADICVVTSLADGMNLVAKEFCAVHSEQNAGVLVLSDTCGAAARLTDAVPVHATEIASIEAALSLAIAMPRSERAERSARMRAEVDRATARTWFAEFLEDLEARRPATALEGAGAG